MYSDCRHDALLRDSARCTTSGKARSPASGYTSNRASPVPMTMSLSSVQALSLAEVMHGAQPWILLGLSSRTATSQTRQAYCRSVATNLPLSHYFFFSFASKSQLLLCSSVFKTVLWLSSTARAFNSRTSWARHQPAEATPPEAMASCQKPTLGQHTDFI